SWAAWRRRQILIMCLVVLATLLCADAWFDTALDWGTRGFMPSLITALVVELPLAGLMLLGTRRLMRLTLGRMDALEGVTRPTPAFWRVPLFGDASLGYRHLWHRDCAESPDGEGCDESEAIPAHGSQGVPQLADVGRSKAVGQHPSSPATMRARSRRPAAPGLDAPEPGPELGPAEVQRRAEAS
ncbi:MAG TPA: hypothetical protein VIV12_10925, partial [Streptosporangiaceae bacterium]